MNNNTRRVDRGRGWQQPLHRHITALTIGLILLIVLPLGSYSYLRGSELIVSGSQQFASNVAKEAGLTFANDYKPVVMGVELLAESSIGLAESDRQRLAFLPLFTAVLRQSVSLASVQVGYGRDEIFVVRDLHHKDSLAVFDAPSTASYLAESIRIVEGAQRLRRYFFDESLALIGEPTLQSTDYHVVSRSWYQQARQHDGVIVSPPYLYYFSRQIGLTVAKKSVQGDAVVAADITLTSVTDSISTQRLTENSELLAFDDEGRVLAYVKGAEHTPSKLDKFSISYLEDLDSSLLNSIAADLRAGEQLLQFEFNEQAWLGSVFSFYQGDSFNLYFAILSPERELLLPLITMRNRGLFLLLFLLVLIIPLSWLMAAKLSYSIRQLVRDTQRLEAFDFTASPPRNSSVTEINELGGMIDKVKSTVNHFLELTESLATEHNYDALLEKVMRATMRATEGRLSAIYLYQEEQEELELASMLGADYAPVSKRIRASKELSHLSLADKEHSLVQSFNRGEVVVYPLGAVQEERPLLRRLLDEGLVGDGELVVMPLKDRFGHSIGVLFVAVDQAQGNNASKVSFLQRLSGFSSVSIESGQMLQMQKALLESFIQLIAGAIDAKSPYTGGHCQRVPELTKMIARAACERQEGVFADFQLTEEQWEAVHIGAWLHDCGKVTTPEFVVDKATKLETIYDRLHEIRMRFEVLKRDAEIELLRKGQLDSLEFSAALAEQWCRLDKEFAFVAQCNLGVERMDEEAIEQLHNIASRRWLRTLPDNIGLSWEELRRAEGETSSLPAWESLLEDKVRHRVSRVSGQALGEEFNMLVPALHYNRGELYNLSVRSGTLTAEERYVIQEHMVQTITMLKKLPFPRHLAEVPEIAGGHHETMLGTGYPMGLTKQQMPVSARMMAVADIFEALTACDRPYKVAKTLSQALMIMAGMADRQHIDGEVFELFVAEKLYLRYAESFLTVEQIDIDEFSYRYTSDE
ncbi:HD-GYP domain-containing protein (c-di-GMP phosphodiesterase class II) [Sinobacterium caligoides]|uniref:HD-GYP domain-containing protein (C-di-GMP phosphodiesterase class II) n=1 Tax=Sinobacterium caligoides TaxID=933926 RepID=A0A3N2DZ16_9GAMM|nr:HD domain-containing phosphohydrolase [Sinobacterium caligoides]ROS04932.1 HD-GYP domain-containing protein (c-di-GMP phosphodiesterase class II) [Sinobacterium caligoides]